jgi:citrate synthase
MLEEVQKMRRRREIGVFIHQVKDKNSGIKLMGFGHRGTRTTISRAKLRRETCRGCSTPSPPGRSDPDAGMALEKIAGGRISSSRKLYPNVDFYRHRQRASGFR